MAYTFTRTGAQIEEIHNTVEDPKSNTQFSDDIRTIAGEYRGLWPDTGGSANKGDTYQTQVSGTPTGQYFTALQNTTVDPFGDDVNWRVVVGANDISSGNSLLSGGNIWPLSIQDALPLDAQSSNIPENISRLTIATENGDSGNELLYLWEPSGDFGSTTHTVTNIAANSTAGYDVTTNQGTFEFLTPVRHAARNAHDPFGWGANGNDTGDDSVAINAMVAEFGFMNLLDKTYRISNPIQVLPSSIGTKWSGMGAEKSILNCVGMGATNAIQLSNPDVFMRLTMMDFGIQGDADRGINLTVNPVGGFQVFNSIFQNLVLSTTRQSLYIPKEFSNTYINCHFNSTSNHAMETAGGVTISLTGCYAHKCGDGFAGFRIYNGATFITCNGIDETTGSRRWGHFGINPTNGFKCVFIGCNMEDFGPNDALLFENFGTANFTNTGFTPRADGTYQSIIKSDSTGNQAFTFHEGCTVTSKGATHAGNSNIITDGSTPSVISYSPGPFNDVYNNALAAVVTIPTIDTELVETNRNGLKVSDLIADRDFSFYQPKISTIPDGNATFTAGSFNVFKTGNTVATLVTNTDVVIEGAELKILFNDANTTMRHLLGAVGRFDLLAGANTLVPNGQVMTFLGSGDAWVQVGGYQP